MTLGDLCAIIDKNGFYITDTKDKEEFQEQFYYDADDFYEQPYAKSFMDREVLWIESKNDHLNIFIK